MNSKELMHAMQTVGRLAIVHVGNELPKGTIVYRLPAQIVLKSRRFANVIGNELHIRKYEDPSHGWLAVPMQWLETLGIVGKISSFSFRRNNTAYLEEDGDAAEFYLAARRAGFTLFVDYHHTDKSSPVRSYPQYHRTGFAVEPGFKESVDNEAKGN
jgi:hypothetical protein